MLERIASPDAPPLDLSQIMTKRDEVEYAGSDEREGILSSLDKMERVFMRGRGNLEQWTPEVLDAIDKCFKTTFMSGDEPIAELFFLYDNKGIALFNEYCEAVDGVLQAHEGKIPPHAWAYFTYFTIWEKRDYTFPIPLGTASVIDCLHKMASRVRKGMIEVSHTVHCVFLALSAHMDSPVHGTPPSRAHGFCCAQDSSILRTWILLCAGLLHPVHMDSLVCGTSPSRAQKNLCARGILLCAGLLHPAHRRIYVRRNPTHLDSSVHGHCSLAFLLMSILFRGTRVLSMSFSLQIIGWIGTLVSWAPKITARSFVACDQYDNMLLAVTLDPLIKPTRFGIGKEVRSRISHMSFHVLADPLTLLPTGFSHFL
jgi:hypothetical protein